MPGPLIDENATEWLTFTDTAAGVPVHFDFEFICNDSCSVYIKGTTWILKGSIFIFAELLGKQTLEPFINLDVSIKEQVLTLEYFDENDEVRSKTFECPINNSTIFRLSNIHDKVFKNFPFWYI